MIDVGLYAVTEAVGEDEKCSRVKAGSKETYVMAQNKSPFLPFGPKGWTPEGLGSLDGKVYIVTGTTTGCGLEAAKLFLQKGADVIVLNRGPQERGEAHIAKDLQQYCTTNKATAIQMDLADLRTVRAAAEQILKNAPRIDALVCNAAVAQVATQQLTVDGFESQLGINHYGHFLLCGLLFQRVVKESGGRIVVVSSNGYKMGLKKILLEDMNWDKNYNYFNCYSHSKLAQTMFAYELQRRVLEAGCGTAAQVQVCHPGGSRTSLALEETTWFMYAMLRLFSPLGQSAEKGSWPSVMCAAENPELLEKETMYGPTGTMELTGPIGICPLEEHALDREVACKLWTLSEEKTQFTWPKI